MIVADTVAGLRAARGDNIGFVPTMGALHEGHLSLVRESKRRCSQTIASIYVNPTQFNNPDDLANYPDTLPADLAKLQALDVDVVFLPVFDELYPDGFAYRIDETIFSRDLCGAHRPGHFTGVLTVVMKLFNIVEPDKAFFGEKDYQQLWLVRKMTQAFFMKVEVVGCPIVREEDGLAMSSRNRNLTPCERRRAPLFAKILGAAGSDAEAKAELTRAGFDVDYVVTTHGRRFGAVNLGEGDRVVRLIDNVTGQA